MAAALLSSALVARPAFTGKSLQSSRAASRAQIVRTVVAQADRAKWYPGAKSPKHLDGSVPGDYGFDPLRLGVKPESMSWFREAELTNGRWAMAAVAGILFTELIGKNPWWTQGAQALPDLPLSLPILVAVEVAVFALVEAKRYQGWKKTGSSGFLNSFPFDPLGMRSPEMEVKEVKNARLAMLAFLGFSSQAVVQGKGPIACLNAHLADPVHNNIYTSKVGNEFTLAVVLLCIIPFYLEAKNTLTSRDDEEFNPIPFTSE